MNTFSGGIGLINPIRYRGYYYDIEISMYYLQSRYYNPAVGRFINADDADYIGFNKTLLSYNIFAYCENNSVISKDSNGMWNIIGSKNIAIAESGDTKWSLANLITGNGNNWKKLSVADQNRSLYKRTHINIKPLKEIFFNNLIAKLNQNGKKFKAYKVSYKNRILSIRINLRFHNIKTKDQGIVKKGIRLWEHKWYEKIMGKKIKVKIYLNISYHNCHYDPNSYSDMQSKRNNVNNGFVHVFYDNTVEEANAFILNYDCNKKYTRDKFYLGAKVITEDIIMHEFGHIFGLDDGYVSHFPVDNKFGIEGSSFAMSGTLSAEPVAQDVAMIMYSFATEQPQHYKYIESENDRVSFVLQLYYWE